MVGESEVRKRGIPGPRRRQVSLMDFRQAGKKEPIHPPCTKLSVSHISCRNRLRLGHQSARGMKIRISKHEIRNKSKYRISQSQNIRHERGVWVIVSDWSLQDASPEIRISDFGFLNGFFPAFSRPDSNDFFDGGNKDFPVSDLSCFGGPLDRVNDLGNQFVGHDQLNL